MPHICRSQGTISIQHHQSESDIPNLRFKQLIDSPTIKTHNHIQYEKSSFSQHFRITSQRSSPQQKKMSLIRNHQLFVDVVKNNEKLPNDVLCPYSPQVQKSQQQIISGYLKDLSRKRKVIQKPQGLDARLDFETELIYQALTSDCDLAKKFNNRVGPHVKQIFKNILATGYEQQIYLDLNRIRSIHLGLNLKSYHFFRFKYHFMNRFMQMGIPVEQLFKCCEKIENVRPYILNEKMEYDVYGGQDGIELCANQMYAKIFADITLEYYFVGIDRATQASKFAKLFFQLIYHMDSPNYTNEVLRERHVKYYLTNVQLTNFKFYLALTLQELGVPFKYGGALLRRMDIYKYAIINKNSLQDYICNFGYNQFIENFVKSCLEEPVLYDLIQRRGKAKFTCHCENIFHYFFRYNVKAITLDDLEEIHYHKTIITEKIFMKLKERAMAEVAKLTDDRIVLEDFDEDWDEIKPLILSDPRMSFLKTKDRETLIGELAYNLETEFFSRQLNVVYEQEEVNMMRNIKCKLQLLVYTIKFFKRTDLEVIHRRFKISESQYFDFQQCFKTVLDHIPDLHYIHGLLEEYKKYIVSD